MILRLQETDFRPSGWTELERMNRHVNRLFEEITTSQTRAYPPVNVSTNEDGAVLTVELPGVRREDIDVSVIGSSVTFRGTKRIDDPAGETVVYHRRERRGGEFERTIRLPKRVDRDRVDAHHEHGILTITAPWKEEEKAARIRIN